MPCVAGPVIRALCVGVGPSPSLCMPNGTGGKGGAVEAGCALHNKLQISLLVFCVHDAYTWNGTIDCKPATSTSAYQRVASPPLLVLSRDRLGFHRPSRL